MRIASENIEPINHFNIVLNPNEHSLAYAKRLFELERRGLKPEEIKEIMVQPIQMEMYYDPETDSIFALESSAVNEVDPSDLFNPYQGEQFMDAVNYKGDLTDESMIEEINAICVRFGMVMFGELQLDCSPMLKETDSTITLIEGISFGKVTTITYNKLTDEEISSEEINLTELESQLLDEVHSIANDWLSEKLEE